MARLHNAPLPITQGTRLGPYEIQSPLGAGGMGEVYRARDTRLDRIVAIKILPAALADDPQFRERFDREARAISQLDHPNICALYDTGEASPEPQASSPVRFLVMQFLEGDTLASRIARGPLPLDQALTVAVQIADALVAAHRAGIVHRDLKPGNVMLTKTGARLLDFGLAKSGASVVAGSAVSMLPTTPAALTVQGQILGTFQYMAPEQLEGGDADARSDIFAFGSLLHEMVTGKKAFEGKSHASLVAAILERQPPSVSSLQPLAPPDLDRIVAKCLAKDPDDRWQSAKDLKDALKWVSGSGSAVTATGSGVSVTPAARRRFGWIPWAAAALAVIAFPSYGWWSATRAVEKRLIRVSVDLGREAVRSGRVSAVISPDGTRLVWVIAGRSRLMTRRLDQAEATVLSDTESTNPPQPFFSPDGQWVGFIGSGAIKKVNVNGGGAVALAGHPSTVFGASWTQSGDILIGTASGLSKIPDTGGTVQRVAAAPGAVVFPDALPDGKSALVNVVPQKTGIGALDDLDIAVVTLASGSTKTLLHGGFSPRYLSASAGQGYIVYARGGVLFGVAFDPEQLAVRGTPVPLVEDLATDNSQSGGGQFALSKTGTLVYLQGKSTATHRSLQLVDAAGHLTPLVSQDGDYMAPRISPDGKRVAFTAAGSRGTDVWVHEIGRDAPTQITFSSPGARELAWAPDSRHVVYGDGTALWWMRADGSSQPQKLLTEANPRPSYFAADGRLAYSVARNGLPDVGTLPIDLRDPEHPRPGAPQPFLSEPYVEVDPAFSPDGKFLAYSSNEAGEEDIYVRPFPGPGGKWKISSGGGKFPVFARATHELFYMGADNRIWSVSYAIQDGAFSAAKPHVWSTLKVFRDGVRQNFDMSPDGTHAVVFPAAESEQQSGSLHATFMFNFVDEVRRRVK